MNQVPIACADFSFPLLPHDAALDLIAAIQIPAVDISLMMGYSHLDVVASIQSPEKQGRDLAERLNARGLVIADLNFTPGEDFESLAVNHPDDGVRKEATDCFHRAVEFARHAQAHHMTMLPGQHWARETREASFSRCVSELTWRVQHAAEADITLSIEPHLGSIVPVPAQAQELVAAVPGLTLTLDYTHFVYQGFADTDCEVLLPFASHFHARGGAPGKLQTTLKKGAIDYRRVLQQMKQCRYPGYFAIEYVWMDWEGCNETDNVSETILLRNLAWECR